MVAAKGKIQDVKKVAEIIKNRQVEIKIQLIEELEDKYNQYTGKNFSFLSDRGILKTEISSLMLLYDTVYYNVDDTIKFFLGSNYLNKPELLEVLKNPLKEFFGFYTQICFDIRYKEFIKIAAKIYFQCYNKMSA